MDRETAFWDKLADRYSRRPVADEAAYQKKLEATRQYFQPDMEVLEIGCGTGSTAIAHAPYVRHIRATDLSTRMVEIAKAKAKAADIGNVTFETLSVDALDVPDASIDVVMAHSILHLLENKDQVIADIHQMLKPGGVFVSNTACIGDMMLALRLIIPVGRFLRLFPLVKVFSVAELQDSLVTAGFEIDYEWQPKKSAPAFIICRKPALTK
ncbi:MAG: methyltransferase domain-containing protein [Gammaproteobacteria bacterium]|jgi:ubiquinone/menaquinone biosynthesis C-methylase UbiE|nr:methyltransferase domain-containing protein [Gammaproteobacteria bacterium]